MKKTLSLSLVSLVTMMLWGYRCSRIIGLFNTINWNGVEAVTDKYTEISESDIIASSDSYHSYAFVNDTVDHTITYFLFLDSGKEKYCRHVQIQKYDEYGRIMERLDHSSAFDVLDESDQKTIYTYDNEGRKDSTWYLYIDGQWQDPHDLVGIPNEVDSL